jgi:hypothetical protein
MRIMAGGTIADPVSVEDKLISFKAFPGFLKEGHSLSSECDLRTLLADLESTPAAFETSVVLPVPNVTIFEKTTHLADVPFEFVCIF